MLARGQPHRSIKLINPLVPILVLILFVVQLFFPFKGWVILLSGLGAMWLLSYIWARTLKQSLRIDRAIHFGWKQVGDRLRERVMLQNNGWMPGLWVEIDDHSDMRDYDISLVATINGWQNQDWYTEGVCGQRGLYTLGPVTLASSDPFGIYKVTVDYRDSVNMMVVPPVVALPEIEIAAGGRIGEGRSSAKGMKQTVSTVGVREYVPGDSMRWLHWPTTARKGAPYVHIFDNEPSSDWWILLDMDAAVQVGEGARSTEEYGVILAASLLNRGLHLGKYVGLVADGSELVWHKPEVGDAHLWAALRSLAKIRPGGPPLDQLLERLRTSLGQNTSLIIITANLSPEWLKALELIKRSGIVPTVLLLDPLSFGGQGNRDAFQKRLVKLGVVHYTIAAGSLDQPKKSKSEEFRWWISQHRWPAPAFNRWQQLWEVIKRGARDWGLLALFFVLMVNTLGDAVRGLETDFLGFIVAGGLATGWLLTRTVWPGWFVSIFSSIFGIALLIFRVGYLGPALRDALARFIELIEPLFTWAFREGQLPNFGPFALRMTEVWVGVSALATRLSQWFAGLLGQQPYYDPVAITLLWGAALWSAAVWACWWIVRKKKPLVGYFPALALVGASLASIGKISYNLALMMGVMLAAMVFLWYDLRERSWKTSTLSFAPSIRLQVSLAAILLSLGLMAFSVLTPAISVERIADFVRRLAGDSERDQAISQSLGLQNQSEFQDIDILDARLQGGLPNEHLIGSSPILSEQVVMTVGIEAFQGLAETDAAALAPLYLQILTYDRYTGRGWVSRDTEIIDYLPGAVTLAAKPVNGRLVRQQIELAREAGGLLYTIGVPLTVDDDFRVSWRIQEDSAGVYDMFGGSVEGNQYRADSWVQIHSVDELRAAGQVYPEWVRQRYLTLPSIVPDNVLSLARDLTAIEPTPYDRAVAIERYLRTIPYTLNVSTPPAGADVTEHFLFVLQRGYCDYYATAMVVLARAAGIPARYVVGYIAEHYDPAQGLYVVTADEAHAWAEVYFPGYGWVAFEPTGGRAAIDRPAEPFPGLPPDFDLELKPLVAEKRFSFQNVPAILGFSLLALLALGWLGLQISDGWSSRLPAHKLLPQLSKRLYRYGRWLGFSAKPGDTIYRFERVLAAYIEQLGEGSYWSHWLLQARSMAAHFVEVFVQFLFSPQHQPAAQPAEIWKLYKQLRVRLWIFILLRKAFKYEFMRPVFWANPPLFIELPSEEVT